MDREELRRRLTFAKGEMNAHLHLNDAFEGVLERIDESEGGQPLLDAHNEDTAAHPGLREQLERLERELPEAGLGETLVWMQEALDGKADVAGAATKEELAAVRAAAAAALPLAGGEMAGDLVANDPSVDKLAVRNIQAGTADLTAGVSPLATGALYVVYE